mmetsp:Transcript_14050/g.45866  ORF Transcript_14050/g.45866 Transcript_14050/m.45866 type:complete len:273 (+) Transcript_14050:275-1093(+)
MPTVSSRGEWRMRRALLRSAMWLSPPRLRRSSTNCFLMRKVRPASSTSASPCCSMVARSAWKLWRTWAGSWGAPTTATARHSGRRGAAARTAAPPREWPTKICGASKWSRRWAAAIRRSPTFEEKLVLAKSPSLAPRPVKSNLKHAMPFRDSPAETYFALITSFPQVKQWANKTNALGRATARGVSSSAASSLPSTPLKLIFVRNVVSSDDGGRCGGNGLDAHVDSHLGAPTTRRWRRTTQESIDPEHGGVENKPRMRKRKKAPKSKGLGCC